MPRSVLVTGGFGALGRVIAASFAAQGDRVARVDFAASAPDTVWQGLDIGGVDLSDFTAAEQVAQQVTAHSGAIDVLVNVAGGFSWSLLSDGGAELWNRMFAMNAITCVNMSKAALPELLKAKSARIINIGANGALTASAGMGAYAASKAAVHKLTESLADELYGHDITVNAVLPSIIDTPANRADMPDADYNQWVQPASIASAILFLASPSASAVNGALLPVLGGSSGNQE